jgi:hypothetical protein
MVRMDLDRLLDQAGRYRSRGIVTATRLTAGRDWSTTRGSALRAEAGDWELSTPDGDRWTVGADLFARDYARLPDGRYAKQAIVEAVRLTARTSVPTREGASVAETGDWLVRGSDGELWTVPAETFTDRYEPVETRQG